MGLFKSKEQKVDEFIANYMEHHWFREGIPQLRELYQGDEFNMVVYRGTRHSVETACQRLAIDKRLVVPPEIWYDYYWLMTASRLGIDPNYTWPPKRKN